MTEEREVVLPLVPSRRLMDDLKYRSFKLIQDRQVWATAWARVEALTAEGWTVEKVRVDWGNRLPGIGDERETFIRRMCGGVERIEQDVSGQGKGSTTVSLRREPRGGRYPGVPDLTGM